MIKVAMSYIMQVCLILHLLLLDLCVSAVTLNSGRHP